MKSPGFTLVELVVGMTAGALVFALAIGAVERIMKLSRDGNDRAEHQLAVARLAQQLRGDVHAASELQSSTDGEHVQLTLTGEQVPIITYKLNGSTITREVTSAGSAAVRREAFRLASNCSVRVDKHNAERLDVAVVRHTPNGELLESRIVARTARLVPLQSIKKGE